MSNNVKKIVHLREERGLKQGELADILGITQSRLSQVENGKRKLPAVVKSIAEYFEVDYNDLIISTEEQKATIEPSITERLYKDMKEEIKFLRDEMKMYREREKYFMNQLGKVKGSEFIGWVSYKAGEEEAKIVKLDERTNSIDVEADSQKTA